MQTEGMPNISHSSETLQLSFGVYSCTMVCLFVDNTTSVLWCVQFYHIVSQLSLTVYTCPLACPCVFSHVINQLGYLWTDRGWRQARDRRRLSTHCWTWHALPIAPRPGSYLSVVTREKFVYDGRTLSSASRVSLDRVSLWFTVVLRML